MTKLGTSKPLKITILKSMREWLKEGTAELEWTFLQDAEHASLPLP